MKIARLILGSILLTLWVATGWAQTWQKVASEGATQAASPVAVLTAGLIYRFGAGASWCDTVTVVKATSQTVWFSNVACTVAGKPVTDPAPGVTKELDIQETSAVQTVMVSSKPVTVPALPMVSTTYTITCTTAPLPAPLPATTTATCTITVVTP